LAFIALAVAATGGFTAFAAGLCGKFAILAEAALFVGHGLAALAGDFALLVVVHGSKATVGVLVVVVGHRCPPFRWVEHRCALCADPTNPRDARLFPAVFSIRSNPCYGAATRLPG